MATVYVNQLDSRVPADRPRRRRIGALIIAVVALLGGLFAFAGWRMNYVPGGLDYSTSLPTAAGIYEVSYESDPTPVPVGSLHAWVLTVVDADGMPIEGAAIEIDGDMPQHGHGLPTRPVVTQELGGGRYLIEGMRFQMGGWWVMDFDIDGRLGRDSVRFNMVLD